MENISVKQVLTCSVSVGQQLFLARRNVVWGRHELFKQHIMMMFL
jgi:hypothetical protein